MTLHPPVKSMFTITLLGVSAIVLGAAGETLWHLNASAASARSRTAGPMAAVIAGELPATPNAIAIGTEPEAKAAETGAAMLTTPIFKPFVMVHIELPDGYSSGEVMAVNDAGQAVGWMHYDGDDTARAFFFDPATASDETTHGVTMLDFTPSYDDSTWAYALTSDSPPSIAGAVMWKGSPMFLRACTWEGPTGEMDITFSYPIVSEAYAIATVSSTTTLAGRYEVSGQSRSVVFNGSSYYPASGIEGEARGVNDSGKVVGWHMVSGASHAYAWVVDTTTDIHPSAYDSSGANAVNSAGHIGGWVESASNINPALWTFVNPLYTVEPFDAGADSVVTALNSHGEMAIMRIDETPGVAIWSKRSGVDHADLLDDLTLMPGSSDVLNSANAINNNGWIGGSFRAGGTGDPQPCLIIPYDVNNNGTSDYREILDGKRQGYTDLDTNNNWLLDWAENISGAGMRTGLHSPPFSDSPPHQIDKAQIVRLQVFLQGPQQGQGLDGVDEFTIQESIDGPSGFCEGLQRWSRDNVDREIVVWLRSTLNRTGYSWTKDNDILPENESQRTQILSDLHTFSRHYAHCIDYIQLGNEVFGGAGQYMFTVDELNNCDSWSGFEEWGGLSNTCKAAASPIVLDWLDDLMWAALEGSALAGRPYRIVSPAMLGSHVRSGHGNSSTVAFQVIDAVSEWANERQMFFDLHVHYESYALFTETTQKITDTYSGGPAGWDVPHRIVVLEWGPTANSGWVGANSVDYGKFREESGCQDPPSYADWEEFVATWKAEIGGPWEGDFKITDSLDDMANLGFHFVCYGPVGQHENANLKYDMKCLWANKTCDEFITDQNRITPMTAEYVNAATEHQITFSTRISCPDCPGN